MEIKINIDSKYEQPVITIQTNEMTTELERVLLCLKNSKTNHVRIFGTEEDQTFILQPSEIDYFYSENRKTFARTKHTQYEVNMNLTTLESHLTNHYFARFSKSVVGNVNQIKRFELSFNGNLCVYFHSGNREYVSKKYVRALKESLLNGGTNE
ncbi:LytTR family DNA-binding domain-containing protein [Fictibacillus nanhaiensis]|uniref:LytTR family DNA-binding domain-containing protein n=1 Tax=Fictibacillus nanhaiensis TaxID=742169 RepID=UPI002E1ED245|nr:LytTR family DNA-binding domain-containing protein [Fictibacillus nanhaiensis]